MCCERIEHASPSCRLWHVPLALLAAGFGLLAVVGVHVVADEQRTTWLQRAVHVAHGLLGVRVAAQVDEDAEAHDEVERRRRHRRVRRWLADVARPEHGALDASLRDLEQCRRKIEAVRLRERVSE